MHWIHFKTTYFFFKHFYLSYVSKKKIVKFFSAFSLFSCTFKFDSRWNFQILSMRISFFIMAKLMGIHWQRSVCMLKLSPKELFPTKKNSDEFQTTKLWKIMIIVGKPQLGFVWVATGRSQQNCSYWAKQSKQESYQFYVF